jgi:hypothetical protein
MIATHFEPWTIPSEDDVAALKNTLPRLPVDADDIYGATRYWNKLKYRFSAAASAVHFLQDASKTTRSRMRSIILHEDHIAVAWPESHAQGIIPYYQENPTLKVERTISLWRNGFHGGPDPFDLHSRASPLIVLQNRSPQFLREIRADCLRAEDITRSIAPWIMEALALPALGMPPNAFTLTLDGNPLPEKMSEIFEVVQADAVWQEVFEADCSKKQINWYKTRRNESYIMSGFPQAMRDITNGNSIVKCNFEIPESWGAGSIPEMGRRWSLGEWGEGSQVRTQQDYNTDPPLPNWLDLRREDIISEDST